VPKSHAELPLDGLTAAAAWAKLFDPSNTYQTVRIGLIPAGAPWPYAGFSAQTSLRAGRLDEALRPGQDGPATSVAVWAIADPAALDAVGWNWTSIAQMFRDFMRDAGASQGWLAESAWIPEFDTYEDFHQTPYENISPVDWFRSGRQGSLTGQIWSRRRLRFVAPRLWLGDDLAAAVDWAALAEAAEVTPVRAGYEVALRPGVDLRALEQVLWPILPAGL
jgi:hypothetical protein